MLAMRFGPGPVFVYEWLRQSRRWQVYGFRSLFIGLLLVGLSLTWGSWGGRPDGYHISELAYFGQVLYSTIVNIELTLVLLAAPAATAGAVCLDKSRGSLLQVMTTDLSDAEIVLGKLGAALIPVLGLVFCVLPVLMLASLLGGIDPGLLLGSFLATMGTALLVCTLAFTLSVWGRKTHEVLGTTYLILLGWLALLPFFGTVLADFLQSSSTPQDVVDALIAWNPYGLMYAESNRPIGEHLLRASTYLGACLGLSLAMVLACVWTIRPATVGHRPEGVGRSRRLSSLEGWRPRLLPTPSLDANPVLWREWSRARPSRWGRFIGIFHGLAALALTLMAVNEGLRSPGRLGEMAILANIYVVGVGLLFMSVRASTSLSEERIRGSLDVLLSTPMTTAEIMAGKWWGTFRLVGPLVAPPAILGVLGCSSTGQWPTLVIFLGLVVTHAAVVSSIGLWMAVEVSKQGRAVALCVGLYVAACVGWPILALLCGGGGRSPSNMFFVASPLVGTVIMTLGLFHSEIGEMESEFLLLAGSWGFFQAVAAVIMFRKSCESFDGRLGRTSDRSERKIPLRYLRTLLPHFGRPPDEPPPAEVA